MESKNGLGGPEGKIFPRNLTARADYVVQGNPTNTRPESGVENCYPGLEYDQRNLEKAFFPGLFFEFHRSDGAILHQIDPNGQPAKDGLQEKDFPLYLWAVVGRTTADQSEDNPPIFILDGLNGLEVWRRIRDLLPEQIAILLGPSPGFSAQVSGTDVVQTLDQLRKSGQSQLIRDETSGALQSAMFGGVRSHYLDEKTGVIDIALYPPGDLTRTLCVPWQFDFRDCGCFYWAANKPDLVSSADGNAPYLNFQRKDRQAVPGPDTIFQQWARDQELDYADLIQGDWNTLPVVINDHETQVFLSPPDPNVPILMNRQEVVDELHYLATVEHALCVEYLYACYSLNAPMHLPDGADSQTHHIFAAAQEIFRIAVDEMRHFHWANEALGLLNASLSIGRATMIGRALNRPFKLCPLTTEQLQWFIDVEKPSQVINDKAGIDGMYIRLQTSIIRQPDLFPEHERLVQLIKLLIDEGEGHYQRFLSVQKHLSDLRPEQYLRPMNDPQQGSPEEQLQQLSDENYRIVLGALRVTFSLGERAGGILLEQARRAMFNLHETNYLLAEKHIRPRFTLPSDESIAPLPSVEDAHKHVDQLEASAKQMISTSRRSLNGHQHYLQRLGQTQQQLFAHMHQLIDEGFQKR